MRLWVVHVGSLLEFGFLGLGFCAVLEGFGWSLGGFWVVGAGFPVGLAWRYG